MWYYYPYFTDKKWKLREFKSLSHSYSDYGQNQDSNQSPKSFYHTLRSLFPEKTQTYTHTCGPGSWTKNFFLLQTLEFLPDDM